MPPATQAPIARNQAVRRRREIATLTMAEWEGKKSQTRGMAEEMAQKGLAYAKQNAPWRDRTRRARQRLVFFAYTRVRGHKIQYVIEGDHGMWYGYYLENKPVSNGGRPILRPTFDLLMPEVARRFRDIWSRHGISIPGTRAAPLWVSSRTGLTRRQVARRFRPEDR